MDIDKRTIDAVKNGLDNRIQCEEAAIELIDKQAEQIRELRSQTGIKVEADGISFVSTADAADGEKRGIMLGKAIMFEHIQKNLFYRGLLSDAVRDTLNTVKRNLLLSETVHEKECIPDAIEYRPVCGHCGAPIIDRVECKEHPIIGTIYSTHEISPAICPKCGVFFDRIEITPPKIQREDE